MVKRSLGKNVPILMSLYKNLELGKRIETIWGFQRNLIDFLGLKSYIFSVNKILKYIYKRAFVSAVIYLCGYK